MNFMSLVFVLIERLNFINNRLSILKDVQRKYKKNIEELIEYQKELQSFVDNFDAIFSCFWRKGVHGVKLP